MDTRRRAYFGLGWLISIIIAAIPFTNLVGGIITRLWRGRVFMALFNFIFSPFFYVLDLIMIVLTKDLRLFA